MGTVVATERRVQLFGPTTVHRSCAVLIALCLVGVTAPHDTGASGDPFAFFLPLVSPSVSDRASLDAGNAWVDVLPAHDREVAIVAATRTTADGARLIAWVREIEQMHRGRYVPAIGRFSKAPRIEDLADLELDDEELDDIRSCRPGKCAVKLSAGEITRLRAVADSGGVTWKPAVQQAFRDVVLERAKGYLAEGHTADATYDDRKRPVMLGAEFSAILDRSTFLETGLPRFADYLESYPMDRGGEVESFLYWSKDAIAGKPISSVTHLSIVRGDGYRTPEVLVAAKQVFATHYMTGSLAITAMSRRGPGTGRYLVYLNRSHVDLFDGPLGALVRRIFERRFRAEAPVLLTNLRRKLEGGEPSIAAER